MTFAEKMDQWAVPKGIQYDASCKGNTYPEIFKKIELPAQPTGCYAGDPIPPAEADWFHKVSRMVEARHVPVPSSPPRLSPFPRQCTWGSLTASINDSGQMLFATCEKQRIRKVRQKPCVRKPYHRLIHDHFESAMTCLAADENLRRELFTLWNRESHLHLGARSDGAWGVGQLTKWGVREIHRLEEKYKYLSMYRSRAACEPLKFALKAPIPKAPKSARECGSISVPESPARNFVWAGLLYKAWKFRAASVLSEWKTNRYLKDPSTRRRMEVVLTQLIYNGGSDEIPDQFRQFIRFKENRSLSVKEFTARFTAYLNKWYQSDGPSPASKQRRAEVAGYVEGIRESAFDAACRASQPANPRPCSSKAYARKAAKKESECFYDALE